MSVVLLLSLAVLGSAAVASVLVIVRSGETRVGLMTALFVLLASQQGITLWQHWEAPLGFDTATGAAFLGLCAAGLGLLATVAVGRTLRELERAETLHWESMEGVRGLAELAGRREIDIAERLPLLLEIGCQRLGLEIGLVSRVRGERYEVISIHAPEDFPIARGAAFGLGETHCRNTLASDRPVALARAADAPGGSDLTRAAFGFEAYLGMAIRVEGEPHGTLVFASREPRRERFTGTHKDLVLLMAQWIGMELEREERPPAARSGRSGAGSPPLRRSPATRGPLPAPEALDLNALVGRIEGRLRQALGPRVKLSLRRAEALEPARDLHLPLDAIVLSLARQAAEAMPDGGKLTLTTANLELSSGEPGVMPAVAPDRYVTLSISETGGAVDADTLAHVFDREAPEASRGDAKGVLPLSTVYRMLQRVGGDLSVEVEPGRGSTFTIFLPLASREAVAAKSEPSRPATAPPPTH